MPQSPDYQRGYAAGTAQLSPDIKYLRDRVRAAGIQLTDQIATTATVQAAYDQCQLDYAALQTAYDALQAEYDAYVATHP